MLAGYPPFYDENAFGIYEKILEGRILFPPHMDADAKDLIRKLLVADISKRLGNLRDGAHDIMRHAWFKTVDWQQMLDRKLTAPIVPVYAHP